MRNRLQPEGISSPKVNIKQMTRHKYFGNDPGRAELQVRCPRFATPKTSTPLGNDHPSHLRSRRQCRNVQNLPKKRISRLLIEHPPIYLHENQKISSNRSHAFDETPFDRAKLAPRSLNVELKVG